jgi:hypothetical protein
MGLPKTPSDPIDAPTLTHVKPPYEQALQASVPATQ